MDLTNILKNIDASVLNEQTATAIAEAFNTAVDEKVKSRITLEVENALSKQDVDHAARLQNLLEAIDKDHAKKAQAAINAINENHAAGLNKVVKYYRTALNEKAEKFSTKVVEELSNFIDLYIEKAIPQVQLDEAVANTTAKNQLAKIREILSFDPASLNEDVKTLISQGKKKIDELQGQLNESYKENLALNEKVKASNASLLIEKKTKGMPYSKKEFITKILSDKSPEYISENFNYVVEMFERDEKNASSSLVEEAKKSSITKGAVVPKATPVISEKATAVDGYLEHLKEIA